MSINRVVLTGRLTRDPELRSTTTGKQVVNFGIAVDDSFNKDQAHFFNVTAWGNSADFVAKYLTKGRLVAVDGRLQQRKYTTNDGQNKESVEVVADRVQGLDKPKDEGSPRSAPAAPDDEYDPFAED